MSYKEESRIKRRCANDVNFIPLCLVEGGILVIIHLDFVMGQPSLNVTGGLKMIVYCTSTMMRTEGLLVMDTVDGL